MVKLDELNSAIKHKLIEMSKKVTIMHEMALETLETDDASKALEVIKLDQIVNAYEEDINQLVLESLALLSPVAKDLRHVVAAIKISSELERIGDYAKNIVAFTIQKGVLDDELKVKVREIGDIFLTMLDHTMDAYDKRDAEWAMNIPMEDKEINHRYKVIRALLQQRIKDSRNLEDVIFIFSLIRNLERAGDHTKNICEHIIYEVKGQHIEFN